MFFQCLHQFEGSHGRVVQILREIKEKAKTIKAVPIPLEPETTTLSLIPPSLSSHTTSSTSSTMATSTATAMQDAGTHAQTRTMTSDTGVQSELQTQGQTTGTQSSGQGQGFGVQITDTGSGHCIDVDEKLTEEDLKKIHDQVSYMSGM